MSDYNIVGIDLAKRKYHLAALDFDKKVVIKKAISRHDFIQNLSQLFPKAETFAIEACGGAHNIGQILSEAGHKVIALKPKDVKAYAKSKQKNDINDAIAICKAGLDPELKHVKLKTPKQQAVSYLHKTRQNIIEHRIQKTNSIITSLQEFGFVVDCGKSVFAKECVDHVKNAKQAGAIMKDVYAQMLLDCKEIESLLKRETGLDKAIIEKNKASHSAQLLETIPGIGPINASILSNKSMESYDTSKDFAASLGLVPKQSTTGGKIKLGSITKQGDRYARRMLVQAARSLMMRAAKPNISVNALYALIFRLQKSGKPYNVICIAVANKLARIAYACVMKQEVFN